MSVLLMHRPNLDEQGFKQRDTEGYEAGTHMGFQKDHPVVLGWSY